MNQKDVQESKQAVQTIKVLLCNSPVLVTVFPTQFKLDVDACGAGVGAVLQQEDSSGIEHPQ